MNSYVNEDDLESFESGDIMLTYFFSFFDIFIITISYFILKSKKENLKMLKFKFFSLLIIDIIIRLLYIRTYYHPNSILKEIFFSVMPSCQFFLILSFLEQALTDTIISKERIYTDKVNSIELSILFLLYIFSYDKFSYSFSRHICLVQCVINLWCLYKLYEYLKIFILEIVENIKHENYQNNIIYSFIKNLPLSSFQFFVLYYLLKICSIFIENSLYFIYINIILIIVKEASKYFIIFILELILFLIDKNNRENNFKRNTSKNTIIEEKIIFNNN